ncbi:hypothetical protein [Nonlabens ponticola]|nr:hypothetical protein [Nonlabens ponticola]
MNYRVRNIELKLIIELSSTEYGIWNMEYGIWNMEYGIWNMEYGIWK